MKKNWGSGGIAPRIFYLRTRWRCQLHAPAALLPVTFGYEVWCIPDLVRMRWRREEISSLHLPGIEPRSSSP